MRSEREQAFLRDLAAVVQQLADVPTNAASTMAPPPLRVCGDDLVDLLAGLGQDLEFAQGHGARPLMVRLRARALRAMIADRWCRHAQARTRWTKSGMYAGRTPDEAAVALAAASLLAWLLFGWAAAGRPIRIHLLSRWLAAAVPTQERGQTQVKDNRAQSQNWNRDAVIRRP